MPLLYPLLEMIVVIVVAALLLWVVRQFPDLDATLVKILRIVVIVIVVLALLSILFAAFSSTWPLTQRTH